jgi:hypothetical protein
MYAVKDRSIKFCQFLRHLLQGRRYDFLLQGCRVSVFKPFNLFHDYQFSAGQARSPADKSADIQRSFSANRQDFPASVPIKSSGRQYGLFCSISANCQQIRRIVPRRWYWLQDSAPLSPFVVKEVFQRVHFRQQAGSVQNTVQKKRMNDRTC